jgi:signal transduction histidine kinase
MVSLADFIDAHRSRILATAVSILKRRYPGRSEQELASGLSTFVDDVILAIRSGNVPQEDPSSEEVHLLGDIGDNAAAHGFDVAAVPYLLGAISDAVGEVGERAGMCFAAADYRTFNQCLDASVARAIESFERARADSEQFSTRFVGSLAHELRNELSAAGMAYRSIRNGAIGVQSRTGGVLGRSLQRMENLISQALIAVQLESGKLFDVRDISLPDLLEDLQAAAFPPRQITLSVESERPLVVLADEQILRSAIGNLVQNALKFTHSGGQVVIRARHEADAIVVEVEDECGGLNPGDEERLFKPFVQASENRTGLGLGLSITRDAVHAQGGEIAVRNLPGRGCVFTIRLPVKAAQNTRNSLTGSPTASV